MFGSKFKGIYCSATYDVLRLDERFERTVVDPMAHHDYLI